MHAQARLQNLDIFLLSERFFPPRREWNFIPIELLVVLLSFGCLYLWSLEINSEQYFNTLVSAYLIYGDCSGLFV